MYVLLHISHSIHSVCIATFMMMYMMLFIHTKSAFLSIHGILATYIMITYSSYIYNVHFTIQCINL